MSFIPDPAIVAIEENKDNPVVQCMLMFIWETLRRETKDIAEWSIEDVNNERYASFKVTFRDYTGVKGTMTGSRNGWMVRGFNLFATISDNGPHLIEHTRFVNSDGTSSERMNIY